MAAYIRANPLHFLAQKPLGTQMPQTAPASGKVVSSVSGPLFAHLGHFAHPVNLARGHNSNGHWEQGAVKHPGIEKAKAKRNGRSTRAQLQIDARSSDPKVAARGRLGLRFEAQAAARKK